jgi:ABC-type multidrug transport system fused ATPase/permease subunit
LLEVMSLGLVIPVIQTIIGGDKRSTYDWLPSQLQTIDYSRFVQLLMIGLVASFLIKNAYIIFSNYFQQRVQMSINNRVVQKLFENYLRQPYEFHLTNSSSVLVRNVQEYTSGVVSDGVGPALIIVTDVLTGIGLLSVLLIVQPISTMMIGSLFVASSWLVLRISRSRTHRWGPQRLAQKGRILEALLAGFGGVKEIKVFGHDREVIEMHRENVYGASRTFYMFNLLLNVPRAVFEVMAVSGVAILVVVATIRDESLEESTLIIALFGLVAFRMLPSVNRIVQSLQQISMGRAGLEGAAEGFLLPTESSTNKLVEPMPTFVELRVSSLQYRYPNTRSLVINIPNLRIASGESLGIVGSSGSGKSTLVDLLIGLLTPSDGMIVVNGRSIADNPRPWQDRIGYVPQHVYLMDTTIRRNVAFGLPESKISDELIKEAISQANLDAFVLSLPHGWDTVVGERGVRLSGGQRQRLGIARALYGRPEVIVLDEATSALDAETEREIVDSFREIARERTLIVVAHRTSTLAYCSRLIRLDGGRIVQDGSFDEVVGSLSPTDRGQ